jgi:hypothetical protein
MIARSSNAVVSRPGTRQHSQPPPGPANRALGLALLVLAGGLALNSLLGPLVADVIDYALSRTLRNQLIGLDAVTLLLVAPLCAAAGVLVLRGRPTGAVLALGPATYAAYMFVQFVVGPSYLHYPRVLAFHLALFVLSGVVAVLGWVTAQDRDLPTMSDRSRRIRGWALIGLGGFVLSRYLPALIGSATEQPLTDEFRAEPAFFWTIVLLDLGVVVPCALATAYMLRHRARSATKVLYAVVGWFALVPPSVAAMAVAMVINDDPHASIGSTVLFITAAAAFSAFALRLYRPLFSSSPTE